MKFSLVVLVVLLAIVCGQPTKEITDATGGQQIEHDLDTAEFVLELIEKKIAKLYKKCLKLGGCQYYGSYGDSYGYGHSSYYPAEYPSYPSYGGYDSYGY